MIGVDDRKPDAAPAAPQKAEPDGSLRARAVRGTAWTIAGYGTSAALGLVGNPIVAMFVAPGVFGVMRLAETVAQGMRMFSDVGIGPAIIQHPRGEEETFLNTAWTIQAMRGAALFVAGCLLAWPFARFYGEPVLLAVIPAVSLAAVIAGFNSTSEFTQTRKLHVGRVTVLDCSEAAVGTVVMIVWASISPTVWAMVGASLIARTFKVVGTHLALPGHRHRLTWDRTAARELIRFGRWIFVSTAITFFAKESDKLLAGKLFALDQFGVYSIAAAFALVPRDFVAKLSWTVLYSALAETARNAPERLHQQVLAGRRLMLTAGVGAVLAVVLVAPWFFGLLYKPEYAAARWMAPLLGFSAWFTILQASADRALLAVGDTRALAMSNLARFAVTAAACVGGSIAFGAPGFVLGVGLGSLAGHVVVQAAMSRKRMPILRQDVGFTLILGAGAAVGVGVPALLGAWSHGGGASTVALAAPVVVLAAACAWIVRTTLPAVLRR